MSPTVAVAGLLACAIGGVASAEGSADPVMSNAAATQNVRVLSERLVGKHAEGNGQGVQAYIGTNDGGLFAVGIDNDGPEYLKFTATGDLAWRKRPPDPAPKERPIITGRAPGGGYWVVGTAFTREPTPQESHGPGWAERIGPLIYEYIRPIDENGHASPMLKLANVPAQHGALCGTEVTGGYVLAGWTESDAQHAHQPVPWMEMIDRRGKQVWSRSFAEDQGQQITHLPGAPEDSSCAGLLWRTNGTLTWAVTVSVTPITPTGDAWVKAVENPNLNHPATFVVQVAADGSEVRRLRHDFASAAFLLPADNGLTLFERRVGPRKALPAEANLGDLMAAVAEARRAGAAAGVRVTRFDWDLTERSGDTHALSKLMQSITSAYLTPSGGVLVSGCDQGTNLVGYIDAKGEIGDVVRTSPQGPQQCSRVAFLQGASPQTVFLLADNDLWGTRVLTLQYSD
jgi:hypothetical protein